MNKNLYKIVFSKSRGELVVVGENASSHAKGSSGERAHSEISLTHWTGRPLGFTGYLRGIFAAGLILLSGQSVFALDPNALPTGAAVQAGTVNHYTTGNTMAIVQTSARAVVNYDTFNIGRDATVNHSGGVMLGRVTGAGASRIEGTLNTSGMVLVNPSGIAIGSTANINAGSFTASTFNISNEDFMAGRMRFERNGTGAGVVNEGNINTTGGGYVALVGATVDNYGRISTQGGDVVLASGEVATISVPLTGSGRVRLELDAGALNAAVANHEGGVIVTEGGHVLMRAAALVDATSGANLAPASVTHMGQIDTTGKQGGRVDVLADHGVVRVGGSIKANSTGTNSDGSAKAGGDIFIGRDEETNVLAAVGDASGATLESKGGFIETSGSFLKVDGISVKAKDWLLDPNDIIIGTQATTTGNLTNAQLANGVTHINASDLSNALTAGTHITIATSTTATGGNGDITVAAAISNMSAGNGLTLNAGRNIVLNNSISVSNITLNAATGSVSGSGGLNASGVITINSATNGQLTGNITGHASVIKTGEGQTALSGNNTFSGGLVISKGSILLGNGGSLTPNYNRAAGTGAITMGDANTGNSNIALLLDRGISASQIGLSRDINVTNNGTGTVTLGGVTTASSGAGWTIFDSTITLGKSILVNDATGDRVSFDGKVTGSGGITVTGGRLTIGPWLIANDFTGSVTINTGAHLQANSSNALSASNNVINNGLLTMWPGRGLDIGALSGNGTIRLTFGATPTTLSIGNNDESGIYEGLINGQLILVKNGTGTQVFSGNNAYNGHTTINEGVLSIRANAANATYGTPVYNIATGAILNFDVASGVTTTSYGNTVFNGAGTITKTGAGSLAWVNSAATFNLGAGSLIDVQQGTFIGGSSNNENWVNNLSSLNIESGAAFWGSEANVRIDALTGGGVLTTGWNTSGNLTIGVNGTSAGQYNAQGIAEFSGNIAASGTTAGLIKAGPGTQILSGTNTYAGTTTINNGTLQIGNGGTGGTLSGGAVVVAASGNLAIDKSNTTVIGNSVTGAGSFTQSGIGTTILTSNANAYGATFVNDGVLQVGNQGSAGVIGTGDVALANGAVLSYQRTSDTTISNRITGEGQVLANITAGNLTVTNDILLADGHVEMQASGLVTTAAGTTIEASTGVSMQGTSGVALNGDVTNTGAGVIEIKAGNGTGASVASIVAASGSTITQSGDGDIILTTDGQGDIHVPNIIKGTGSGDVIVAAGIELAAGETGGNLKSVAGNTIQNSGSGKTLLYTSSAVNTSAIENLVSGFDTFFLSPGIGGASNLQNSAVRLAFDGGVGIAGGAQQQVMFRESINLASELAPSTFNKTYGDSLPGASQIAAAIVAGNAPTITKAQNAGTFVADTAEVADELAANTNLSGSLNAFGRRNASTTGYAYSASADSRFASSGQDLGLTLIVDKADAVVTGNSFQTTYNGLNQSVTGFTATGLMSGETESVLTGVTAAGANGTNAGTYFNIASGTDSNYNLLFEDGLLVIDKASATVTAGSGTVTYNATHQTVNTFTVEGLVAGDSASTALSVQLSGGGINAGTYEVTASGTSANYDLTFVNGTLTIEKANAIVTANSGVTTYNGQDQSISGFTATGLVGGEGLSVLNGVTASTTARNAGTYTTTASGTAQNYNLTFVDGSFVIHKADAIVTADSLTTTYDGTVHAVSGFTASGLFGSDVLSGVSVEGSRRNAGETATIASGSDGNYNLTFVNGSLLVNRRDAQINAVATTLTYNGTTQSQAAHTTSGFIEGDDLAFTGGASRRNVGTSTSNLSASGNDVTNYNITVNNANLVIEAANATVTASPTTVIYNGEQQTQGFTTDGFIEGDAVVFSGEATRRNVGTQSSNMAVTGDDVSNYNITITNNDFTISHAQASVVAIADTRVFNGQEHTQAVEKLGFFAGDQVDVVGAGAGRNAGTHTSNLSVAGDDAGNYVISITNADLTIEQASLQVTAQGKTVTYDAQNHEIDPLTVVGLHDGVAVEIAHEARGRDAGTYSSNIRISGADANNYILDATDADLVIDQRGVVLQALPGTSTYNGQQQVQSFNQTGLIQADIDNGSVSVMGAASGTAVGSYTSNLELTGSGSANYRVDSVENTTFEIGRARLVVRVDNVDKVYDGVMYLGGSGLTFEGFIPGESIDNSDVTGAPGFSGDAIGAKNAGQYTIKVSGLQSENYEIETQDGQLLIRPRQISVTSLIAQDKPYDGNTSAVITGATFNNLVEGENLLLSGQGRFATAEPGAQPVLVDDVNTLSRGEDGSAKWSNYELVPPFVATGVAAIGGRPPAQSAVAQPIEPPSPIISAADERSRVSVTGLDFTLSFVDLMDDKCSAENLAACTCVDAADGGGSIVVGAQVCSAAGTVRSTE